jgi:hypothetical protein
MLLPAVLTSLALASLVQGILQRAWNYSFNDDSTIHETDINKGNVPVQPQYPPKLRQQPSQVAIASMAM